jgi:RimJ/RimL family protein N-acetyltransferase
MADDKRIKKLSRPVELRRWTSFDNVEVVCQRLVDLLGQDDSAQKWTLLIPYPYTKEHGLQFINMVKQAEKDGSPDLVFAITDAETKEIVGGCGAHQVPEPGRSHCFSLGYWVATSYRQNGYAKGAVLSMLKLLPKTCLRVEAAIFVDNIPSRRVLESCGLRCESELLKNFYIKNGKSYDAKLFGMERGGSST